MKTVQMTLEEDLVREVDRLVRKLGTTRSAFTRRALRDALARAQILDMERRHREGYRRKPVRPEEFGTPEKDLAWGDAWAAE